MPDIQNRMMPGLEDVTGSVILENLYDGVYLVDRNRRITYWNRGAELLTGYSRGEVVGRLCHDNILRHVDEMGNQLCFGPCPLVLSMEEGRPITADVYLHHKDGHRVPVSARVAPLRNDAGEVVGAVEIFSDNSIKLQLHQRVEELERMAMLDALTGVPNRRYLEFQLDARCNELERYGWGFGLLFMDIDYFKSINDAHGHDTGDQVLRMVARTLTAGARVFDTVGRWGGEEFVGVIANVDSAGLIDIARRFGRLVASSELDQPKRIGVTLSIGAALARPGESVEDLLRRADACLFKAKESGRNEVRGED